MKRRKRKRSAADHLDKLAAACAALEARIKDLKRKIEDTSFALRISRFEPPRGLRALITRDRMARESRAA